VIAFLISWLFLSESPVSAYEQIRHDFQTILNSTEKTARFISKHHHRKEALSMAYLSAAEAMMAEEVFNPYTKYRHFTNGTKQLDDLINKNQQNIEMRFLRLMIQKESPSFLGYRDDIGDDLNAFCTHFSSYRVCGSEYKTYMKNILIDMFREDRLYFTRLNKLEA
jgi:hypothetical protein